MAEASIPQRMFDLYFYRNDLTPKKKFDYILDFLAYIAQVDSIATPSVPEAIFDKMVMLGRQYVKQPLNFDLADLYYDLKIGVYARPKLKQKNALAKFVRCLQKDVILVQHNNIRCGEALLYIKRYYPDKNIIHYGYSHSLTEYHIALICSKLYDIDSYILCVDKGSVNNKMESADFFNLNHVYLNQWKKPPKKDIRTN